MMKTLIGCAITLFFVATSSVVAAEAIRGFELSGAAKLTPAYSNGEIQWKGRKFAWEERYTLERGCALVHAQAPIVIDAGPARAYIDKDTAVVAHLDGTRATRFVNLTDRHRHSFKVTFGGHFIELDPGFELVLVQGDHLNPKEVAIQENIGWREMRQQCADGLCVFVYRVSASDMMQKCKIYKQLSDSDDTADIKLREELVKSVAALETMFVKKKGPYNLDPFKYGNTAEAGSSG